MLITPAFGQSMSPDQMNHSAATTLMSEPRTFLSAFMLVLNARTTPQFRNTLAIV